MNAKLPQPYASIYSFARAHSITFPRTEGFWRLTERVVGQVNGLPTSRGILTATNGILCYIEQETDGRVGTFLGHLEWFVADSGQTGAEIAAKPTTQRKPSQREINLLNAYE